jgi:HEAT repeat protein
MKRMARPAAACRAILTALAVLLSAAHGARADTLQDLIRFQDMLERGHYERALEIAGHLATDNVLFENLPAQVVAERNFWRGNRSEALDFYRQLTPAGSCLVSYFPTYLNSCQRMDSILDEMGDVPGRIEMRRRLVFGAGVRDRTPPSRAYRDLATAYQRIGDVPNANAFDRTVVHCFDADDQTRQALDALEARQAPPGEADEIILNHALSDDPVLARAGRSALPRLHDPVGALERLVQEASTQEGRLELMILLPLDDLEPRLHYLLLEGEPAKRRVAHDALKLRTGLSYPHVDEDGEAHFEPLRSSVFHGVWGTSFLLSMVEDGYESETARLMALDSLGQVGDPRAREPILQATHHDGPAWRLHAVRALTAYEGDRVERTLVLLADDPDPLVRLAAVAQIARRTLPDAVDILAEALAAETHPLVAAAMAEALASLATGETRALDTLADLGEELQGPALAKAGEALWLRGDARGRRLLEAAQKGSDPARSWATAALAARPIEEGQPLPTPLLDELSPALKVLEVPGTLGPDSTPEELLRASLLGRTLPDRVVLPLLESSSWSKYRPAALAVANSNSRAHLGALRGLARTSRYGTDGGERITYNEEMLRILGWLEDDESLPLFREVLSSNTYGSPRVAAAWALGRLRDHDSIPVLVAAFLDPATPFRVRKSAAQALSRFEDPDLGAMLLGPLESRDARIRRLTILLLQDTGARHGGAQLQRLAELDPDPELRRLASLVAAGLGD